MTYFVSVNVCWKKKTVFSLCVILPRNSFAKVSYYIKRLHSTIGLSVLSVLSDSFIFTFWSNEIVKWQDVSLRVTAPKVSKVICVHKDMFKEYGIRTQEDKENDTKTLFLFYLFLLITKVGIAYSRSLFNMYDCNTDRSFNKQLKSSPNNKCSMHCTFLCLSDVCATRSLTFCQKQYIMQMYL